MKDILTVFTFAIAALFLVASFSTLKPATVTAAVGGMGKPARCSLTASPTPGCRANGFAALSWPGAAMAAAAPKDHFLRSR